MLKIINMQGSEYVYVFKNNDMDMCSGPLFVKILSFAFPIMIMNLL